MSNYAVEGVQFRATALFSFERRRCSVHNGRGVQLRRRIQSTRFFRHITSDMRILYDNREFEILSVLDLGGKHDELQIVAVEKDSKSAQTFNGDDNNGE